MFVIIFLFIGTTEVIVVAAVVLLLFGGKKVPELMRGLGRGVKEFNDAKKDIKQTFEQTSDPDGDSRK